MTERRIEFAGPYLEAAQFWVGHFYVSNGIDQPTHVRVKLTLEADDVFARWVKDRPYGSKVRECIVRRFGEERIQQAVSLRPDTEFTLSTRHGPDVCLVTDIEARSMLDRWRC